MFFTFFPQTSLRYFPSIDTDSYAASKVETLVTRIFNKNSPCIYSTQIKSSHFRILIEMCPIWLISFIYICRQCFHWARVWKKKNQDYVWICCFFCPSKIPNQNTYEAHTIQCATNLLCCFSSYFRCFFRQSTWLFF